MIDMDGQEFLSQATLIGLINRDQAQEARGDAADGSVEAAARDPPPQGPHHRLAV